MKRKNHLLRHLSGRLAPLLLTLGLFGAGKAWHGKAIAQPGYPKAGGRLLILSCHDGDTCTAVPSQGAARRSLRLIGIDAPEVTFHGRQGQTYGEESRRYINQWLKGQWVDIELYGTDVYGRYLALIRDKTGADVNEELIREGLAFAYRGRSAFGELAKRMLKVEEEARNSKKGLWSLPMDKRPQNPGDFRHSKSKR